MIVEVRRLVWDDWNVPHIARNDVTPEEVEAACHARPVLSKESYKERLMILGMTPAGRVLAIVIGPVPDAPAGPFSPFHSARLGPLAIVPAKRALLRRAGRGVPEEATLQAPDLTAGATGTA